MNFSQYLPKWNCKPGRLQLFTPHLRHYFHFLFLSLHNLYFISAWLDSLPLSSFPFSSPFLLFLRSFEISFIHLLPHWRFLIENVVQKNIYYCQKREGMDENGRSWGERKIFEVLRGTENGDDGVFLFFSSHLLISRYIHFHFFFMLDQHYFVSCALLNQSFNFPITLHRNKITKEKDGELFYSYFHLLFL